MKSKKILVWLLAMVLLMSSATAGALSLPEIASKSGSGYYPLGIQTPAKYYTYFVGGTRRSGEVRLEYGNGHPVLSAEISEWSCVKPHSFDWFSGPTGLRFGNGTVACYYSIPSHLLAQNAYINAIEVSFNIGSTRIVSDLRAA